MNHHQLVQEYTNMHKRKNALNPYAQKGISRYGSVSACLTPKGKSVHRRVIASAAK